MQHDPLDDQTEDDMLVLCSLVEEYKDALETTEAENERLKNQIESLLLLNNHLREKEEQQQGVIERLESNVNQLVEELEQTNSIISAKNNDLESLQHCLGVIHKRKVEVDDQTQHEQRKTIERLQSENAKITESYSMNLRIMEDYLELINEKDSTILDLQHIVQTLKQESEARAMKEKEEEEGRDKERQAKESASKETSSSVTGPNKAAGVVRKGSSTHMSPPSSAPPTSLRNISLYNSTSSSGAGDGSASGNNGADVKGRTTAGKNLANTLASDSSLSAMRAASAAVVRRASLSSLTAPQHSASAHSIGTSVSVAGTRSKDFLDFEISGGNEEDENDEEESPVHPVKIVRNMSTRITKSSTNNDNISNNGSSLRPSSADSAASSTTSSKDNSSVNSTTKWSDVGKHERLFQKVDIIRARHGGSNNSSSSSKGGGEIKSHSNSSNHKTNQELHDFAHDAVEYGLDDSTISNTSVNEDSVELFIQSDSSNNPSPERLKPAKPIFKPPFTKPFLKDFIGKASNNGDSISGKNNAGSYSRSNSMTAGGAGGAVTSSSTSADKDTSRGTGSSNSGSGSMGLGSGGLGGRLSVGTEEKYGKDSNDVVDNDDDEFTFGCDNPISSSQHVGSHRRASNEPLHTPPGAMKFSMFGVGTGSTHNKSSTLDVTSSGSGSGVAGGKSQVSGGADAKQRSSIVNVYDGGSGNSFKDDAMFASDSSSRKYHSGPSTGAAGATSSAGLFTSTLVSAPAERRRSVRFAAETSNRNNSDDSPNRGIGAGSRL
jgi:hypothetical protein